MKIVPHICFRITWSDSLTTKLLNCLGIVLKPKPHQSGGTSALVQIWLMSPLCRVYAQLNAPDQQTVQTSAFTEWLTLNDDQLMKSTRLAAPGCCFSFNCHKSTKGRFGFPYFWFLFVYEKTMLLYVLFLCHLMTFLNTSSHMTKK